MMKVHCRAIASTFNDLVLNLGCGNEKLWDIGLK
jgi:hypothetical protein